MGFFNRIFERFRSQEPARTETAGAPGYHYYGGYVGEPEKAPDLQGVEKYRSFARIVSNTSVVASSMRFYLNFLAHPGWRMDPADENDRRAVEIAEFCDKAIHGMRRPWHRVVKRAGTAPFYGFDIQEVTLRVRDDGQLDLLSVDPRSQWTIEQWDIDETGHVHGVLQRSPWDNREIYLPRWKIIYIGDDSLTDNPQGLGLLRQVYPAAKRLERYEQLEMFGFETDLRGIPVGYAPLTALHNQTLNNKQLTQGQVDAKTAHMRDFLRRHIVNPESGLLLDSMTYTANDEVRTPSGSPMWKMELLTGGGRGLVEVGAAIQRMNHEIARIMGMEHLLLGQDRGTQALSKDKTNNVRLQIESTLTELAWSFQRDLVRPLCEANGWPEELWPSIEHDPIHQGDVEELVAALEGIARAGAPLAPDDPVVEALRALMRLPDPPEIRTPPELPRTALPSFLNPLPTAPSMLNTPPVSPPASATGDSEGGA